MSGPPPLLRVDGLEAGYGELRILFGVDLEIGRGEHVLVFGPNGAGKSTLVKVLAGLLAPTGGRLHLDGRALTGASPEAMAAAGLAYVPQLDNVFPTLSVAENLEIGGVRLRAAARRRRMAAMYDWFPALAERRRQAAGTLSGGERQMLALARALIPEPALLLLDEPSAGVAPRLAARIFEMVADLREDGTAVLMVEQNARQALGYVDRGLVLEGGRVRVRDSARRLLDNPEIVDLYLGSGGSGAAGAT